MLNILPVCCLLHLAARQDAQWVEGFTVVSSPKGNEVLAYREADVGAVGTAV